MPTMPSSRLTTSLQENSGRDPFLLSVGGWKLVHCYDTLTCLFPLRSDCPDFQWYTEHYPSIILEPWTLIAGAILLQ